LLLELLALLRKLLALLRKLLTLLRELLALLRKLLALRHELLDLGRHLSLLELLRELLLLHEGLHRLLLVGIDLLLALLGVGWAIDGAIEAAPLAVAGRRVADDRGKQSGAGRREDQGFGKTDHCSGSFGNEREVGW
jgi:hypothetical protein